ncbi:uncharacterized protein [Vulpes vulpes]|uniref:Uncharacterized protein isoform X2 n=1 Tax=Vulpes vulpes TaxID=9627 RepID=A0ABM4YGH0_VULVU
MEKNTQWKESNLHQMFVNVKMEQMMSSVNVQNSAIASEEGRVFMRSLKCNWKKFQMFKMTATGHDSGVSETLVPHASCLGCPQMLCKALITPSETLAWVKQFARCHPLPWQTGGLEKMGSLGHCLYPHQPPPLSSSNGCRRSHQGGEPLLNPS